MDRKLINERIRYWTRRRCYQQAATWRELLDEQQLDEQQPIRILEPGWYRLPCTNTLNNGGR